jgi:hypothetical protein
MNMTVGDLRAALAHADPQLDLRIAVDGTFAPVVGVSAVAGSPFVVLRGLGKTQQSPRFSIQEEGVLGKLVTLGLSDEEIGQVLGRPPQSVERKRKALGLSQKREP